MKIMKIWVITAIAGVSLVLTNASASARTIPLSTLLNSTASFTVGVNATGAFSDNLTFTLPTTETLVASLTDDEHNPFLSMVLGNDALDTGLDVDLYSGTPTGAHSLVETDSTDPSNSQTQDLAFITLGPGSYYYLVDGFSKGTGSTLVGAYAGNGTAYGEYTVDTTVTVIPEPASWVMMMIGFGVLGFRLRKSGNSRTITG